MGIRIRRRIRIRQRGLVGLREILMSWDRLTGKMHAMLVGRMIVGSRVKTKRGVREVGGVCDISICLKDLAILRERRFW